MDTIIHCRPIMRRPGNGSSRRFESWQKHIRTFGLLLNTSQRSRAPTRTWLGAADTLLLAQEVGLPNVGVTIDTGHSLVAGENLAEAAALLMKAGKLFHMHFNDNYRFWDDDMIVGSVHLVEFIELLFWLKDLGYSGWYSMDQYPYREDAQGALRNSVEFLQGIEAMLTDSAMEELRALTAQGDAVKSTAWVRSKIFPHK